jgi:heme/copper-type cytochrome/quinol oxidase subunit 3
MMGIFSAVSICIYWNIFCFLVLNSHSYSYHVWILIAIYIIICFSFYCFDCFSDYNRGLVTIQLNRIIQTMFIWFVLSEISLFGSVFWSCFSCSLVLNEFDSFYLIPIEYVNIYKINTTIINIFFLDIINIIINTFLLFVSGLCVNVVLFSINIRLYEIAIWYLLIAIYFGLLFLGNQFYEFNLLTTTFSVNCYCSSFLLLDSVHFTHVLIGVLLLTFVLFRISNMLLSSSFILILYIAGFYWHFVDVIWFILVRGIYLTL